MSKVTRRHFATASGLTLSGIAVAGVTNPAALAAQTTAASGESPEDLLARRKASIARSSEELREFELKYTDEPVFRLVLK